MFLIALAMALIMGPAAYQRHAEPEMVTHRFVRLATRLVLLSMFPFTAGISLDFYVIAQFVLGHRLLGGILAVILFACQPASECPRLIAPTGESAFPAGTFDIPTGLPEG